MAWFWVRVGDLFNILVYIYSLFRLLWFAVAYGERLRAVVDVGFSTADNN
jgi:hypothetical protein